MNTRSSCLALGFFGVVFGLGAARAAGPAPADVAPGFDTVRGRQPAIRWDPNVGPEDLRVPREIGCQIVNTLMTREPLFTFTVKEKVHAALTVYDTSQKYLRFHALAVFMPGERVFCMGGKYETHASASDIRDWEPGTYAVHPATDCNVQYEGGCKPTDWPADTYRFELVDLTPKIQPLADGFEPNPMRIDGLRTDWRKQSLPKTEARCGHDAHATSKEAALVLTLDHPWAHLRIWSEGGARDLVVTDSAGRSACSNSGNGDQRARPYADLVDVPAGPLEIRAIGDTGWGRERGTAPYGAKDDSVGEVPLFAVSVEDFGRPRARDWESVPVLEVGKGIAQPLLATQPTALAKPSAVQRSTCDEHRFGEKPALLLDVTRPLDKVWLRLVTEGDGKVLLSGPLGPDRRGTDDFEARCYDPEANRASDLGRLEMGRYEVFVGFREGQAPFAVALGDDTTTLDPLQLTLAPPESLPLLGRALPYYFGFLPSGKLPADVEQSLFLSAPTQLFAVPKFDLDEATAHVTERAGQRADIDAAKRQWPKKDEPLLIVSAHAKDHVEVLAADATSYGIDTKYLADAPSAGFQVPTEARNVLLDWEDAVRIATKAEEKDITAYEKARERADTCNDRVLDAAGPEYRLATGTRGGSVTVSNHYSDRVLDAAYAKCGYAAVEAMQARILKKLDASYRKRLAEGLAKIRARLAAPR